MQYTTQIDLRDSVQTNPEKFESEALFLPSILIRPENGSFQKRPSNRRNLKTPDLRLLWTRNILITIFFRNDGVMILSVICDCCVVKPLLRILDKNYLMRF